MKISIASVLLCLGLLALPIAGQAQTSKPGWSDNQLKALAKAKAEKKMVLMDFTGSDWCGWCIKMDKEVFSTPEFKQYAQDHLVLVELDFPHSKPQDDSTKEQNATLKSQYDIHGFPTLVVLDADGKKLKQFVGFQQGGPKAFIAQLDALNAGGSSGGAAIPAGTN